MVTQYRDVADLQVHVAYPRGAVSCVGFEVVLDLGQVVGFEVGVVVRAVDIRRLEVDKFCQGATYVHTKPGHCWGGSEREGDEYQSMYKCDKLQQMVLCFFKSWDFEMSLQNKTKTFKIWFTTFENMILKNLADLFCHNIAQF